MGKIEKILVANRGEIAVRIMRTCREMDIESVAVFSEADDTALHLRMADEVYAIGDAPSSKSYLVQEKILDVAAKSGADAIHPGYGFLSENADFAEACQQRGFHFIGPPAGAIRKMGDKTAARTLMEEAGVPMAPGTTNAIADPEAGRQTAEEIGYPVLIKAAAGGGGKGMRIVRKPENFASALDMARGEAESAFGDGRVFIEKYIDQPRHIEFQILADQHGNTVHLFERECSIQRRHQKVIEEAPSSVLTPAIREQMGRASIAAAESCGYVNAGTVEFLVDADLNFYFMEMNTRLQVEHPVTEAITGLDLVREQIRIAQGEELGYNSDDISMSGHAIESRVYAEDPASNFLPDPGPLLRHSAPDGPGVRVDSGVEEGGEVPVHYDPMISKLITHAPDRASAIRRMERALAEYDIAGVQTTIPFCRYVMQHDGFRQGEFSTHFVDTEFDPEALHDPDPEIEQAVAVAAALVTASESSEAMPGTDGQEKSNRSKWTTRRTY